MVKPTLVSVVALDGHNESALLAFASSAARGLEAPFGVAILDSVRERDVEMAAARVLETSSAGVVASIGGHSVVVGSRALFADLGLSLDRLGNCPDRLQQRGQHVLFVAIDGRTAGVLGVIDAAV